MDIRKYMSPNPNFVGEESETGSEDSVQPPVKKPKLKLKRDSEASESNDEILHSLSQEEISQFLDIMKEKLDPKHEKLSYKSGCQKFDWQAIKFKDFSAQQCLGLWLAIQNHQRRYRTLTELIVDAKQWNVTYKKKIVGLPKKPLTSYLLYFQKEYQKLKESDPKTSCILASKIISEKFKTLSPHKKNRLQDEAQSSRDDYKCKMAAFQEEHPDLVGLKPGKMSTSGKIRKEKAENGHIKTPFRIFLDEKYQEFQKHPNKEDVKYLKVKEEYGKLDDTQKAHYIHLAKLECINSDQSQAKPTVTKDEERLYLSVMGVPVKPPQSPYALFTQLYMTSEEVKNIKTKERMKIASERWHILTEEQKKEYNVLVKQKNAQYEQEYAAFLGKLNQEEQLNFLKFKIVPMGKSLSNGDVSASIVDLDPMVKTEIENCDQEFPKSARAFFKLKTGESKSAWKDLEPEEKEKWTRKFEKRKRKHEKALQNSTDAAEESAFPLDPPLYNSTPLVPQNNLLATSKRLKL